MATDTAVSPTRLQVEVRDEALAYPDRGRSRYWLELKRQATQDPSWYPSVEEAQDMVRRRGGGYGAVGVKQPQPSKRKQLQEARQLGGGLEHALIVGHTPRRRDRKYPHRRQLG